MNFLCFEITVSEYCLLFIAQIQNDDGFPSQICDLCRQKIIDAYIIRGKCVKSATLLRKILNIAEDSADAKEIVNSVAVSSPPHDMLMQTLDDTFAETEDSTTVIEFIGEMSEPDDNHTTDDENTNDDSIEMLVFSEDSNIKTEMIEINGDLSYTDHVKQTSQKAPKQEKELCKICGAIETRDNIDAHLKTHDDFLLKVVQQAQFYRCDSCRVIYLTVDEFAEHLSDMNNCQMILRQYTDAHCTDYQFLDDPIAESLAGISIISGAMSKNRAYMCYCGFESFEIADFVEHFRNDHANDTIELLPVLKDTCRLGHMCGICSATQSQCHTFDNMKDAILHVFCHRDEFECVNTCRRAFRTLKMLRRHWQREHSNNDLIFSCQHCQQMFANNDELKKHTKQECKGRKLSCIHCRKHHIQIVILFLVHIFDDVCSIFNAADKKYFHKQALEVHMRKHSEDKRFKCDHCPKKFVQSNDLKNHLR